MSREISDLTAADVVVEAWTGPIDTVTQSPAVLFTEFRVCVPGRPARVMRSERRAYRVADLDGGTVQVRRGKRYTTVVAGEWHTPGGDR